ncbi:uncharacterized protein LOC117640711 [Thrips palmi]|uniref:Uncharacterized protein LOC117640711 n=1 Tax=Thrips palmi TaxID=161013 RepID=A0A6P8ZIE5_THRPL|nr:uncharacterized protein LOC117640711 [Thrips palmi]
MADSLMDFSERCRLCIEPKRLSIDIFSEEGRRIRLKSKINKHLSLKISQSDRLPSQICYQCLFRLETWVSFKQLCLERDQVMKTWSQSYQDEAFCEVERTFNGGPGISKSSKPRQSANLASKSSQVHSFPRDSEGSNAFVSCSLMDDAKSDNSVWEVVKVDDTENGDCETSKNTSQNNVGDSISPETANIDKHGITIRHKSRKPSKVRSSGSDASNGNDVDTSCTVLLGHPVDHETSLTLFSSVDHNKSSNSQDTFPVGTSPIPVKRKRGRPSKASLLREREMKKLMEQEKALAYAHVNDSSDQAESETIANDEIYNDDIEEVAMDEASTDEALNQKATNEVTTAAAITEEVVDEPDNSDGIVQDELETQPEQPVGFRSNVVTQDFAPIERDTGSGVTEVVLDDPIFGSMKFTLSVVEMESPTSSPIPTDTYKYYNYASSSGNISSDSGHREDFEGFESPNSSCVLKPLSNDDTGSSADVNSPPKSQDDVTSEPNGTNVSSGTKRKRSSSASSDFKEIPSIVGAKSNHISKSLENVNDLSGKQCMIDLEERNAHSEGESSETTNKRFRRKPPLFKDFFDAK